MKDKSQIEKIYDLIDTYKKTKFPGMTYEEGVAEALGWVLEEIPDEEFVVNFK
jgi:hypothetical protein